MPTKSQNLIKMSKNDIIVINCSLTDSIYNIRKALEASSICRVRKIFATNLREECNDEPIKKIVYVWVEWDKTNAAWMFTARLMNHREEALFKLDRWDQPIVTERDEYGNPIRHDHWVVRPCSRVIVQDNERCYPNKRENKEKWETYLAQGESAEDTDEEEESETVLEEDEVVEGEKEEQVLSLEPVLEIPILNHNSPIPQLTPEPPRKTLTLFMPQPEAELDDPEAEQAKQLENDTFMRENFNIVGEINLGECDSSALSKEELKKLSRGENVNLLDKKYCNNLYNECDNSEKKITFPNGFEFNIKNKNKNFI